jgi:hypothetical protein
MSIKVKAHVRGAPDPLTPEIEAKRSRFESKWGIPMVSANDDRLAAPIADPVPGPGRLTLEDIAAQLKALADRAAEIGRHG